MNKFKLGIDNYSYHRYFGEVYPGQAHPRKIWSLGDFVDHLLDFPDLELIETVSVETCFLPDDAIELTNQLSRLNKPLLFAWGHPDGFMDSTLDVVFAEFNRYLSLSSDFGANVMRIVGSSINYFDQPHRPQLERTFAYLEKVLPLAEKYQVKLAIENHGDFYMHEFLEIIEHFDSPYLGLTLDTGNFLRFNEDPIEVVNKFSRRVYIVHAKDVAPMSGYEEDDPRRLGCVPAGKGITEFKAFFSALQNADYQGSVLIEISRMHPDYEASGETAMIQSGLAFLHSIRRETEANYASS